MNTMKRQSISEQIIRKLREAEWLQAEAAVTPTESSLSAHDLAVTNDG